MNLMIKTVIKFLMNFIDTDKSLNSNLDKLIKDSYLGSINTRKDKNSFNNNENLILSNKFNSPRDISDSGNLIRNLKTKIQKQEIDIKFLHEKLKKLQNEKTISYSYNSKDIKKESRLDTKEVFKIHNVNKRSKILLIYYSTCTIRQN